MSEEVKNSDVQEEQTLQTVQDTVESKNQESEIPKVTTVQNLGQALDVLMQAADLGRQKGIYDWHSLSLISQSFAIIKTIVESNKKKENEQ